MERDLQIQFKDTAIPLPCFFPSISSVKTNLSPVLYLQVLAELGFPHFLLSAYDFVNAPPSERDGIEKYVADVRDRRDVLLMDSGNYESYWHRDVQWKRDFFLDTCRHLRPTIAFSFDDRHPGEATVLELRTVLEMAESDQRAVGDVPILPIIHANLGQLPSLVGALAGAMRPRMVAVAERELGDGLLQRVRTVTAIRSALNERGFYCPLHILGTGNPYSILAFALSGADSFDGLEWCQTVVDFSTGHLSHFQHWDLFASTSPVKELEGLPYQQKVLAHNLVFYAEFMQKIRDFEIHGKTDPLIERMLTMLRPAVPAHLG